MADPDLTFGLTLIAPTRVLAHCDSLDGSVVKAAQRALDTRNSAFALIWVQAKDEPEIRTAFERTLAVHGLSPQYIKAYVEFMGDRGDSGDRCHSFWISARRLIAVRRPPPASNSDRRTIAASAPLIPGASGRSAAAVA